jgi:hypothetical protein
MPEEVALSEAALARAATEGAGGMRRFTGGTAGCATAADAPRTTEKIVMTPTVLTMNMTSSLRCLDLTACRTICLYPLVHFRAPG